MAAPQPPDYSQYISAMTDQAYSGLGRSTSLYDWANAQGAALKTTADTAGSRAGTLSDATMPTDPRLMAKWEQTYSPLYQAQAADATRMIGELPQTEEQYAGKFSADTGAALDAAKATQQRTLQGYGLTRPGVASTALDMTSANQRAAALTAASETGRLAARSEARGVTGQALTQGLAMPQVGAQQAGIGLQSGQQQVALPATAITTTAGAYSPSLGYYQSAYPYLAQWGSTMANAYNQNLAAFNANENSGGGTGAMMGAGLGSLASIGGAWAGSPSGSSTISGWFEKGGPVIQTGVPRMRAGGALGDVLHTAGSIGGTVLGSMVGGPIGGMVGGRIGAGLGDTVGDVVSGETGDIGDDWKSEIPGMARGGDVTQRSNANYVPSQASPSRGAITDDVPARLNAGEFVLPKDVVSWMGEEKLQKLIQSTRQKRQEGEHAQAEMSTPAEGAAIRAQAPSFVSEGARV